MRSLRMVALAVIAAPVGLVAQGVGTGLEEPRVWIRNPTPTTFLDRGVKGSVVRIAADTFFVRRKGGQDPIPVLVTERTRIQLPQGMYRATGRGTRLGAGIGAGTGLLLVIFAGGQAAGASGGGVAIAIPALFGMLGAGVGAAIGSMSYVESWSPPTSVVGAMPALSRVPGAP